MSTKTKTPVSIVPTSKDVRVVTLAAALGVTTRAAWAMAAAAWEWLAEAADEGVVPGASLVLLDTVVDIDVKGLGEQLVAAGLVGVTQDGLVLPAELVAASKRLKADADDALERRRKKDRERKRKSRKNGRRNSRGPASATGQPHVPRSLGKVCGDHVVMLLWGRNGPFVDLKGASPPCTASAAAYDYDKVTLADALELLVPRHKANKAEGGGYRVPTLQALEDAARLERDRQRAADAAAARETLGNNALLEAAADDGHDDHERDSPHLSRPVRGRPAGCPSPTVAGSTGSPCGDTDLGADSCHSPAADTAASSSSSSFCSSHAQQNTTNKAATSSVKRDAAPAVQDAVPAWVMEERRKRQRARAEGWAVALGVSEAEVRRMYQDDKEDLRCRLIAAGVDPDTDRPVRGHDEPVRPASASSAARAAGIPLPDLGVGRLRDVVDQDVEPVATKRSPRDDQAVDETCAADQAVDEIHDHVVGLDMEADRDAGPGLEDDRGLDDHDDADLTPEPTSADAAS